MATKEFGAAVPEEEYLRFQQRFGMIYGATKWFINEALRSFNNRVEKEPTLVKQVQESVEEMVAQARNSHDEDVRWVPGVGFRKGTDPITPEDWAAMEEFQNRLFRDMHRR